MDGLLAGRRILITGAARGIGLAVARSALAHGAHVAMADIDGDECASAAAELSSPDTALTALAMDVTDEASIASAMRLTTAAFGGLDGLVNNAATKDESNSGDVTFDLFDRVLAVNLTSILRVSQAAIPFLTASPHASIVNTLSVQALFGQPNSVAYATAKGAGLNLTRCMAVDLAPQNIRVNAVAPGFIDTRMAIMTDGMHEHATDWFRDIYVGARKIPMARAGVPEECADTFVFLLSDLSRYITGQVIAVDGGLTATY